MDNATHQKIKDLLSQHEAIGVVVGKNPSIDEMGAALSLYLYLSSLQKKVSIASPTTPIVEISSLVGIQKVGTSLDGDGGDLVVSFPYRDNEIQKVRYTIENGLLNIIVEAGENGLTFVESEVQYKRGGGVPTLLFVVGTPRLSDLGSLFDPELLKDTVLVNIDNKVDNQGFGDVALVSSNFSSVSEIMSMLLKDFQQDFDVDIAQNLLSGISDGTSNFQNPNTSYAAFEMAGFLLKRGAQRQPVQQFNQPAPISQQPFVAPVVQNPVTAPLQRQQNQQQNQPRRDHNQQRQQQQVLQSSPVQPQPLQQSQPQQKKEDKAQKEEDKNPTPDWLMPKVYRGTSNI